MIINSIEPGTRKIGGSKLTVEPLEPTWQNLNLERTQGASIGYYATLLIINGMAFGNYWVVNNSYHVDLLIVSCAKKFASGTGN